MRSDRALVVLLPHPDDEFALLPFLIREKQRGRDLHLVWMTDGGMGAVPPAQRARESLDALAANDLADAACTFIGMDHALPDGRLHEHARRAHAALAAYLDQLDDPLELWLPAWEGGHQDHDSTHAIGRLAGIERDALIRQYPTYNGEGRRGPFFRVLLPLSGCTVVESIRLGVRDALRLLLTCLSYRSQWRSFAGLMPLIAFHLLLFRRPMVLCAVEPGMPSGRPHLGGLLYERRTKWRWQQVEAALSGLRP